jgi:hypothetical protein
MMDQRKHIPQIAFAISLEKGRRESTPADGPANLQDCILGLGLQLWTRVRIMGYGLGFRV